ncbi:hypothetical protein niasHT_016403 [Heterodera trifolii]|uniref:Uncharacterized protein n=1 Tax=Heterodera trifolii TaxID=157864 RepID=A0ABD2KUY3_9BILA
MAHIFLILLLLLHICCAAASLLILNAVTFEKDANDYAVGNGTTILNSHNLGPKSAVLRRHKRKSKKDDEKIITKNCTTLASVCSCGWGACHPKKKYRKEDDDCCAENHQWKCCEEVQYKKCFELIGIL